MSKRQKLRPEEPVMSDVTILVSVEDLINLALGPEEANVVNFKMLQTILHILARQLRLLETKVDIRIGELPKKKKKTESSDSPTTTTTTDVKATSQEEKERKLKQKKEKEKAKLEKMSPAEKEKYLKEQEEEEKKMDRMSPQEKEKYLQNKEKEEKQAKQKKKEQQLMDTMSPEEKKMYLKQKEIDESIVKDMSPKEKEKFLKQREREAQELQRMSPKERDRYMKETQKEQEALLKMSPQDKEKHLKEKEAHMKEKETKEKVGKKGKERESSPSDDDVEVTSKKSPKSKSPRDKEADEEEDRSSRRKSVKDKDRYAKEEDEGDGSPVGTDKGKKSPKGKDKSSRYQEEDEDDDSRAGTEKGKKSAKAKDKTSSKYKEEDEDEDSPAATEKGKKVAKGIDKSTKYKEEDEDEDSPAATEKEKKVAKGKDKSSKYKEEDEDEDSPAATEKGKKAGKGKDKSSKYQEEDEDDDSPAGTEKGKKSPKSKDKSSKYKEEDEDEVGSAATEKGKKSAKAKDKTSKDIEEDEDDDDSPAAKGKKSPKGKDKSFKEEDEDESPAGKERDKKAAKEKEKTSKEKPALSRMTPADKEKEVLARLSPKEREALERSSPKEREKFLKERIQEEETMEKMERMSPQEEKEALAQMKPKEREKYLKEKEKRAKSTGSGTSIAISEVERQKEKVLVVEKGPTTRAQSRTRSSIEVVTISQFNILEGEVAQLKKIAGPLPMPAMPDNKKLMTDIAKGSASLTDTMQAMQVSARVQAAEEGLARMAGLLTQLAASGALPDAFAGQIEQARAEMEMLRGGLKGEKLPQGAPRSTKSDASSLPSKPKSVAIDSAAIEAGASKLGRGADDTASVSTTVTTGTSGTAATQAERQSRISQISGGARRVPVTRIEMNDAIQVMRDDLVKNVALMTKNAAATADNAAGTAKGVADKIEIAVNLNNRISDLFAITSDYAEQLSGFDSGLNTQMSSFQEQIALIKGDLKVGLATLETANNNAETAAVMELTERYLGLAHELENSASEHQHLTSFQKQLTEELRNLMSAVEMLREQKADRDEVWDGLRDKADMSKLEGLVTEQQFAHTRGELDDRLELCYEKFAKQENVWHQALKDLTDIADTKATIMQLLSLKSEAQDQLNAAHEKLKLLELQLGEPKAAILTRLLSKDGTCAACKVPALQEGVDQTAGMPYPMPYFRAPPPDELCVPAIPPIVIEDETIKSHACKRWAGGSHTLVSRTVPREVATKLPAGDQPVKRYTGQGTDGRVYNLITEVKPCTECNRYRTGAGDAETSCQCWPGVTDPKTEVENIEAHFY